MVFDKLRKIVAKCAFFAYFGTFSVLKNVIKKNIDIVFFSMQDDVLKSEITKFQKNLRGVYFFYSLRSASATKNNFSIFCNFIV